MKTFFCKLIPPRVTFTQDMSAAEAALMQQHSTYWSALMEQGQVVTFGLVAAPDGPFGIGIVEVNDDSAVHELTSNDPTIRSNQGFRFEIYSMPFGARHVATGAV